MSYFFYSSVTYLYVIIIKKNRSFESKENIHKKEVEPYHGFGY